MVTCLNCDMVFEGAFCSSCGQKATTQRINWQSFILELPQTLFSIEKGFGYTLRELTFAPRRALEAYLAGKRVNFLLPFSMQSWGLHSTASSRRFGQLLFLS